VSSRVLITGLGALCAQGSTAETIWENLVAGRSFLTRVERLESVPMGGEVRELGSHPLLGRRQRRFDRATQLAIVAAHEALADAGLHGGDGRVAGCPERAGAILGTSRGAAEMLEGAIERFRERGAGALSPHVSPLTTTGSLSAIVARELGLRGPNLTVSAACSSATQAIGAAFEAVRHGRAEVMLAGGAEACLTPFCVAMLDAAGILSHRVSEPARACRPFDRDRDGIVLAEGAGLIVLESEAHARARGARAYAEVAGFGATCDAGSLTGIPEDGEGLTRAIAAALQDAQVPREGVDYVNAHGTATRVGDRAETAALKGAFGGHAHRLAISSTKSMTGHLLGAVGGIEAIVCALVLQRGVVPPTINLDAPDPECDLDYVPLTARDLRVRVALSTSMGFGGNNACLVLKQVEGLGSSGA
jgi:3-oxoacyl-[acyl-carrier-protein] synthase II